MVLNAIRGDHAGSGSVGAAFAFPVAVAVGMLWGWPAQAAAAVMVALAGAWAAGSFVQREGDAGWIVVDEAAGVFVATIGLGWWPGLVSWVVFRAADIFKGGFPGVARAERLGGSVGVMADDIVAGLYGLAAGHLVAALT